MDHFAADERKGKTPLALGLQNDDAEGLPRLLHDAFAAADAILVDGAPIYVAHPSGALSLTFGQAFLEAGWHLHQTLIWLKDAFVVGHSDHHYRHEPILYGWKGTNRRWFADRSQDSVFEVARPRRSDRHPTAKPVALVEAQLLNSTAKGSLVYDPFAGSGTTVIAAEQLGRRCVAMEIDPAYVDVIVERWEQLTGNDAVRAADGQAFSQLQGVRDGR